MYVDPRKQQQQQQHEQITTNNTPATVIPLLIQYSIYLNYLYEEEWNESTSAAKKASTKKKKSFPMRITVCNSQRYNSKPATATAPVKQTTSTSTNNKEMLY